MIAIIVTHVLSVFKYKELYVKNMRYVPYVQLSKSSVSQDIKVNKEKSR